MTLRFLGTGTSTGVPQIGCNCKTCRSNDARDKRLRASALLEYEDGTNVLIDCGPDFYHQMLQAGSPNLDALLLTHIHYDHVGGIDDLRPFCADRDFPVYCKEDVYRDLRTRLPYCFAARPYPGTPKFDFHIISDFVPFTVGNHSFTPIPIRHYKLKIVGFLTKDLAYVTDCKEMPEETIKALTGIDTLVINALRIAEHLSHLSLEESLALVERIKPRRAYLTHISHQMGLHKDVSAILPDNVFLAYDGLTVNI